MFTNCIDTLVLVSLVLNRGCKPVNPERSSSGDFSCLANYCLSCRNGIYAETLPKAYHVIGCEPGHPTATNCCCHSTLCGHRPLIQLPVMTVIVILHEVQPARKADFKYRGMGSAYVEVDGKQSAVGNTVEDGVNGGLRCKLS